jgi:hypothetical protein
MSTFTALLDLPEILEGMGFNVIVAEDWELGQGNYLWTNPHTGQQSYDGQPWAYMVHHTATSSATPPPHDTSKANAWVGLLREGKLYQDGGGIPTIYLASAGPARTSSGYGYRPAAWDYTFDQKRAPTKAQGSDGDTALNRYAFNVETVHRGDGSPLDGGVLDCVAGIGIALEQMFALGEMTLGHLSWSQRKIDPYWNNDHDCIVRVQELVAGGGNVDPKCPWTNQGDWKTTYPQCESHYIGKVPIEWGVNTGVCNLHNWSEADVQKMIDAGRIKVADNSRDDGAVLLTSERYWTMEGRAM